MKAPRQGALSHMARTLPDNPKVFTPTSTKWITRHLLPAEAAAAATTVSSMPPFATSFSATPINNPALHLSESPRYRYYGIWHRDSSASMIPHDARLQCFTFRISAYNCIRRRLFSPRRRVPHQGYPDLLQLRREGPREP
jgi:hypothetical protein